MGENFFKYLPSEIVLDILSRVPTREAMACKCVCKPWLGLLASPEFVNSHMSRSVPGIAVETRAQSYKMVEFVDEEHRWDVTFNFKLPFDEIHSSTNGLIFLKDFARGDLILCNPITRDYIKLPSPRRTSLKVEIDMENFGFWVSRMTGQYKVVRIFGEKPAEEYEYECQVYTVGTGSWRKVPFSDSLRLCDDVGGVLVNGNLHWTVKETRRGSGVWICCFDIEAELFRTFPTPPLPSSSGFYSSRSLCVLWDCLCVSDISTTNGRIIIWLMEDEQSWTKIFVIPDVDRLPEREERLFGLVDVWPIIIFENGDVLMQWENGTLFCYSNKTKTFDYGIVSREDRLIFPSTIVYAPSFVSLKSFAMENVSSF
ncbi:F-box protein At3g07870-like [Salvia hispanica]|uniref:F-box protein At3g07870-like n=1 Tax=Salvia hispanica TaxID=49212 RepID=UPI0020099CC8|nr:F-box protein At3g07870-like [Salvia hispanica]